MFKSPYRLDFLQETSLHGCKNIGDKNRPVWLRVAWLLLFLSAFSYWVFTSVQVYLKTKENKMRTVFKTEYVERMEFPAVTICAECPYDTTAFPEDMQKMIFGMSDWDVLKKDANSSINLAEIGSMIQNSQRNISSILKQVRWAGQRIDTDKYFEDISTRNNDGCFVFNGAGAYEKGINVSSHHVGMDTGLEIIADIRQETCRTGLYYAASLKLYISSPRESGTTNPPNVVVSPGTAANVILTKKQTVFLPHPYKASDNRYCIESSTYSRSNCIQSCVNKKLRLHCPCMPKMYDEEDVDLDDLEKNCKGNTNVYIDCWSMTYSKLNNEAQMGVICDCPYPCVVTEYETSLSFSYFPTDAVSRRLVDLGEIPREDYARKNLLKFGVYFKDLTVEKTEYKPEHDSSYIKGTVGGQLGLFLGASVATCVELMEVITLFLWSAIQKIFAPAQMLQN